MPRRHSLTLFRQRTASRGNEQASIISTLCAASAQAAGRVVLDARRAVLTRAASGVPAHRASQAGAAVLYGARRSQDDTRHRAGGPALLQRGLHGRQYERLFRREEKGVSEGATCDAARLTEGWRGCAAPARTQTAC